MVVNEAAFFLSHRLVIARAARDAGYDVHVATPAGLGSERIAANGLAFHALPLSRSGMHPLKELRTIWSLSRLVACLKPDIVHAVTIKPILYCGWLARTTNRFALVGTIPGLGYVFSSRGMVAGLRRGVIRMGYRVALSAKRVRAVFQNKDDLKTFLEAGLVTADSAALIRGSGVNLREFFPTPEPGGEPVVVLASRMLEQKGVREFVVAAERLRRSGVVARFALVGAPDPDNPTSISGRQLREWHESGVVEWWGRRENMPEVFRQAIIICLPTYYGEGVPKVLIEAAACGRPIVATDWPGCREVVTDGENGLLVPARDVDALVEALQSLLGDSERRKMMGACSRRIAEANFGEERVVNETLNLYRDVLSLRASERIRA